MLEHGPSILRDPGVSRQHPRVLVTVVSCQVVTHLFMRDLVFQLAGKIMKSLPMASVCQSLHVPCSVVGASGKCHFIKRLFVVGTTKVCLGENAVVGFMVNLTPWHQGSHMASCESALF